MVCVLSLRQSCNLYIRYNIKIYRYYSILNVSDKIRKYEAYESSTFIWFNVYLVFSSSKRSNKSLFFQGLNVFPIENTNIVARNWFAFWSFKIFWRITSNIRKRMFRQRKFYCTRSLSFAISIAIPILISNAYVIHRKLLT